MNFRYFLYEIWNGTGMRQLEEIGTELIWDGIRYGSTEIGISEISRTDPISVK